MSFLKFPFLLLWRLLTFGLGSRQIKEASGRISRFGDRFRNAGDKEKASISERYARIARLCFTAWGAQAVEEEFLERIGQKPKPAPYSPRNVEDTTDRSERYSDLTRDAGYTQSYSSDSTSGSSDSVSGQGGEFGGAGATGSWEAEAQESSSASQESSGFTDNS
ncbi:MAG: hypothetical protein JNM27_04515 [Leptospirales bacterium]|nr:hypothetical protein [Leptospirales bacterium]